MIRIKMLLWFCRRPTFWPHLIFLLLNKVRKGRDRPEDATQARSWSEKHKEPFADVLLKLGLLDEKGNIPKMPKNELEEARSKVASISTHMGGAADLELLYAVVTLLRAENVVETGVAYGWSSLAILSAQERSCINGSLVSVDMPYPLRNNENFVGMVVSNKYHDRWTLLRVPDRVGLRKAIGAFNSKIDLCHYDSDKSWYGRSFAYPILWASLRSGGIFISDDIQDNLFFKEFCEKVDSDFFVTEVRGKYIGILKKPEMAQSGA